MLNIPFFGFPLEKVTLVLEHELSRLRKRFVLI